MYFLKPTFLVLICCLYFNAGSAQTNVDFTTIPSSFGINNPNAVYALDIPYDDVNPDRQSYHLFLPDTTESYPLVIFIHGGGFTGSSKDVVLGNPSHLADINYYLERGIAFASVGYRLIESMNTDPDGVIKCLTDAKRGLQHLRYNSTALHINPAQIALTGTSAGAGTGLWIATHRDMADLNSPDPVLRQSTRVCAVNTSGSQATYDLYKWETEVYYDFDGEGTSFTLDSLVEQLGFDRAANFYGGFDSTYQMVYDEALIQYRQEVDMLYHLSADDPPLYINNGSRATHPRQDLFHHSLHGEVILANATAASLPEVKAVIRASDINTTEGESVREFLIRHLKGCAETTSTRAEAIKQYLQVYPNPANGQFTIDMAESGIIKDIKVFSISGKLALHQSQVFSERATLKDHGLTPGLYIVQARSLAGIIAITKLAIN